MILSHRQIEEIASAAVKEFNTFFFGKYFDFGRRFAQFTPIDQFARDFLGLSVSFAKLSTDGSICGLTAYTDTEYEIEEMGVKRTIPLKQNQVILDRNFIDPRQMRKLCRKRRFTLAHECAHQILYQYASDEEKAACQKVYSSKPAYSLRDLKTHEDWNEWQANTLGAAILMPQKEIDLAMWSLAPSRRLISYDGYFSHRDHITLSAICQQLGVSRSAAVIRLQQLGYLEDRKLSRFDDPSVIWP